MTKQLRLGLRDSPPRLAPAISEICIRGNRMAADPSGALFWREHSTLLVSDLHLETGASHAGRGRFLPPYDTDATLDMLDGVIAKFKPRRVIALGDNFHDVGVAERLPIEIQRRIRKLRDGREWYWITGNHDPRLPDLIGGRVCQTGSLGGIKFRHEPVQRLASNEIAGHLHPAARLSHRGNTIRRKCFVTDGDRLIMPAFGSYTGGLNVLDQAFAPLFGPDDYFVWMLGRDDVYPVSARQLLPD